MNALFLRVAVTLVRAWTFLYTTGMPQSIRDARRMEIESDLAEACGERPPAELLAAEIFSRFLLGVPDDLAWRIEHPHRRARAVRRLAVMTIVATVIASLWLLVGTLLVRPTLPLPPGVTWHTRLARPLPPPPPPPPPPCPPPSIRKSTVGCTP